MAPMLRTSENSEARTMTIKAINPATGEQFASHEEMTDDAVREAVDKAHDAFLNWRRAPFPRRAPLMRQVAQWLRDHAGKYAELMAQEMGKPVRDGVAEIQKCALTCDFYAENAERFLADQDRSRQELCHVSTTRRRLGGDAVEFSVLAGLSIRGAVVDGW
jgi:acyl-CoA reductase-like NAD-dependent aldehyde dehydrogenase